MNENVKILVFVELVKRKNLFGIGGSFLTFFVKQIQKVKMIALVYANLLAIFPHF